MKAKEKSSGKTQAVYNLCKHIYKFRYCDKTLITVHISKEINGRNNGKADN